MDRVPPLPRESASGWPKFREFLTVFLMDCQRIRGLDRRMLIYSVAVRR
jgi:hypothetical protein